MSTFTYLGPTIYCYVCKKDTGTNRDICSSFCAGHDDRAFGSKEVRLWAGDETLVCLHRWTLDMVRSALTDIYMRYEDEEELPELDEVDMALSHIEDAMKELDALLTSGISLMPDRGNRQLPLEVA